MTSKQVSNLKRYSMRWTGRDGNLAMHEDTTGQWVSYENAAWEVNAANHEMERLRAALGRILKLTQDPRVYPNVAVITLKVEDEAVRALRPAVETAAIRDPVLTENIRDPVSRNSQSRAESLEGETHEHQWKNVLMRVSEAGPEKLDICKCGMYRIRSAENGDV